MDARPGHFVQSEGATEASRASRGPTSPSPGQPDSRGREAGPRPSRSGGHRDEPCQPDLPALAGAKLSSGGRATSSSPRGHRGRGKHSRGPTSPRRERAAPASTRGRATRPVRGGHRDEPYQPGTYATGSGSLSQADCIASASGYVMTPDGISPLARGPATLAGAVRLCGREANPSSSPRGHRGQNRAAGDLRYGEWLRLSQADCIASASGTS